MNLVAPSPSRTIACASCEATSVIARPRAARSASLCATTPEAPLATTTKASLVEVSPSTVMQLNELFAAWRTSASSARCDTFASVATNPSIVAMSGRIMPAPFAIPVTVTSPALSRARREAAFGTVSVVMIASAAAAQLSARRSATAAGSPAMMRSAGSGSMITPVENGSTFCAAQPSERATASHTAAARARPSSPVPAFALPVLTTRARISAPAAR